MSIRDVDAEKSGVDEGTQQPSPSAADDSYLYLFRYRLSDIATGDGDAKLSSTTDIAAPTSMNPNPPPSSGD